MGMFDTIYIKEKCLDLFCPCGGKLDGPFQTKSLDSSMDHFYLKKNDAEKIKLFKLEIKEEYYKLYTEEEIKENNKEATESNFPYSFWKLEAGDGYYPDEAHDPENMKSRDMGELPHQYVNMYDRCEECKKFVDVNLKFDDGVMVSHSIEVKDY